MKVELTGKDFNKILKTCKPFICRDKKSPIYKSIEMLCDGKGTLSAIATDRAKAVVVNVPCNDQNECGAFIIPFSERIEDEISDETKNVSIIDNDEQVIVYTGKGFYAFKSSMAISPAEIMGILSRGNYADPIRCNPKILSDALSAFKCDMVEINTTLDHRSLIITGNEPEKIAIVMLYTKSGK